MDFCTRPYHAILIYNAKRRAHASILQKKKQISIVIFLTKSLGENRSTIYVV
jgi:hypothetical protein